MRIIRIYNYDGQSEHVAVSAIESVVEAGHGVHDHGAVILRSGRRIALGQSMNQAQRIIKQLEQSTEPDEDK